MRRSFNGTYSPLYQAGYMLGGLELRALHHELVDSGRMTERAFHDAVLQGGAMPIAMVRARLENIPIIERKARDAGFLMLASPEMYLGHDENDLVLGSWDNHPNVAGHHIIANRLAAALQRNPVLLGRPPYAATGKQ